MKWLACLMSSLLLMACSAQSESKDPKKASKGPRITGVAAVIAAPMTLRQSSLGMGTVLAAEQVEIKTEMAGRIAQIAFREGQKVAAGALLVKLDDSELQASRAKALAKLEYQKALWERRQRLQEKEALSQQELESGKADFESAQADLRLLDAQLSKTRITAPFAGVLGLRLVSPGAVVSNGQVLTTLVQRLPARLELTVNAWQSAYAVNGAKLEVSLGNGQSTEATVYAGEGVLNANSRSQKIRALLADAGDLVPGTAVEVSVPAQERKGIPIPPDALSGNAQGPLVYVYKAGKAMPVQVKVATRTPGYVLVSEGLSPGDTVLKVSALNMRAAQAVKITEITP